MSSFMSNLNCLIIRSYKNTVYEDVHHSYYIGENGTGQ
jgi:hypothetical protein